jgi:hypothetical protein
VPSGDRSMGVVVSSRQPPAVVRVRAGQAAQAELPRRSHQAVAGPGEVRRRRRSRSTTSARRCMSSSTGASRIRQGTSRRRTLPNCPNPIAHPGSSSSSCPAGAGLADQRWQPQLKSQSPQRLTSQRKGEQVSASFRLHAAKNAQSATSIPRDGIGLVLAQRRCRPWVLGYSCSARLDLRDRADSGGVCVRGPPNPLPSVAVGCGRTAQLGQQSTVRQLDTHANETRDAGRVDATNVTVAKRFMSRLRLSCRRGTCIRA